VAQDQRVEKLEKFLAQRGQPCTDRCRRQGGWRRKLLLLRTEAQAPPMRPPQSTCGTRGWLRPVDTVA